MPGRSRLTHISASGLVRLGQAKFLLAVHEQYTCTPLRDVALFVDGRAMREVLLGALRTGLLPISRKEASTASGRACLAGRRHSDWSTAIGPTRGESDSKVLRAGSGIRARYSSTFFGSAIAFRRRTALASRLLFFTRAMLRVTSTSSPCHRPPCSRRMKKTLA
jgi:hypothetical protein